MVKERGNMNEYDLEKMTRGRTLINKMIVASFFACKYLTEKSEIEYSYCKSKMKKEKGNEREREKQKVMKGNWTDNLLTGK